MLQHLFSNVGMLEVPHPPLLDWGCLLSEMSINYIVECLVYTLLRLAGPYQTLKPTNKSS